MKHTYENGNVTVTIDDTDGTRVCCTDDDEFKFKFPTNIDVTISHKCDNGCPYCYLGCTEDGEFGDIMGAKFIETLHPYTELAFNLNFPCHPYIIPWLNKIKDQKVFANATVSQKHFMEHESFISQLVNAKLIYGLGVSYNFDISDEFIKRIKKYPNAVIHVIAGAVCPEDLDYLARNGLKILILGYKEQGRGIDYINKFPQHIRDNLKWLESGIMDMINEFKVVSFDNLAVEQLNIKDKLPKSMWEQFYHGDDGSSTFAIDIVDQTYSISSSDTELTWQIEDNIDDMFMNVRCGVTNREEILYNRGLLNKYPFMKLADFMGNPADTIDFTSLDDIPVGWKKCFGELLCEDLDKVIPDHLKDTFYFVQTKEKYGQLTAYPNMYPDGVEDILSDYAYISSHVCACCGKVGVPQTGGWILPLCKEHWTDGRAFPDDYEFLPEYSYYTYQAGKDKKKITRDVSYIVNRIKPEFR